MKKKFLLTAMLITLFIGKSYSQTNLISQDTMIYCDQDSANIQLTNSYNLVAWEKVGSSGLVLNNQLIIRESGYYYVSAADSTLGDTTICFSTTDTSMSTLVNVPVGYIITDVIAGYYGTPIANCSNPLPGSCHFDATNIIRKGLVGKKSFQYYQGSHPDLCTGVVKSLYVKLRCMKYIQDSIYVSLIKKPLNNTLISDTIICSNNYISLTLPTLTCDTTFIPVDTLNLSVTSNNDVNSISTKSGRLYQIKVSNAVSYGGGSGNQADGAYKNITASPLENITWRINGMQFGTLTDFRPIPNGYNPSHEYYFYLLGNGEPFVFRANDCCLGDNSGQFQFIISEVLINQQCNLNYIWSDGNIGNTVNLTPSNIPYTLSLSDGYNTCTIDTFNVTAQNTINTQPQTNSLATGNTATFTATTSDPNPILIWQSDFGQGFQTLNNFGNYSGVNSATLNIANVQLSEHNQPIRVISTSGNCIDTSNVAVINIVDTTVVMDTTEVMDTTFTEVFDTTEVMDTTVTEIFDTSIIQLYHVDTIITEIFDTSEVLLSDTNIITLYSIDTITAEVFDTLSTYDTILIIEGDTQIITLYNIDTLEIEVFDTVSITETLTYTLFDTVKVYDTTTSILYQIDSIVVIDTIQIIDTLFSEVVDTSFFAVQDTLVITLSSDISTGVDFLTTEVNVYPNPASTELIIDIDKAGNYTISLSNISGQIIFLQSNILDNLQIDISNFTKGLYFITITDNDGLLKTEERKIVIE